MNTPEKSFTSHILRYVGVGLISGSIVHAGTLGGSSLQYIVLIITGIIAFVVGTILEENKKISKDVIRFIIVSVFVSIGIGMVSGGTQHYLDNPSFASYIIPIGLLIGYISYIYRDYKQSISVKRVLVFVVFVTTVFFSLYSLSHTIPSLSNHHGESNSHGH